MDKNYFLVQKRALQIIGFKLKDSQLVVEHPLWLALLLFSLISHNWPMVVYGLQDLSDLTRLTDNLAVVWQGSLSTFKTIMFVLKRREIGSIIQHLHKLNEEKSTVPSKLARIQSENELDNYVSTAFRNAAYGTLLASILAPLGLGWLDTLQGSSFRVRTPMDFNFWLDDTQPEYYWPIYFWGIYGIAAAAWTTIAVDTLFSWLIHNVVVQFQLLKLMLNQGETSTTHWHLVKCIQQHRLALELAKQLSEIYAEIVFVQYMLSYLQLCTLAYRFSLGGWNAQVPFRACFLMTVLVYLISYCYGGEYLKQESSSVAMCIYESFDWPNVKPGTRRLLLMMMRRSQQASKIFGYMFDIDFPLFLWVIRTAGSFLAMLKTLER
ncbi:odorant receptor 45a [Drosophila tropicalis]|uniref:odorant receptor 45a n=1 Tax=Drosophila tropicalis TaxID=46794 RepID=UPI0035AB8041